MIPSVELWEDEEQIAEEDYDKINLTKLNLIEHGHFKNPVLAGIAIGLMSQIYDAGGKDYFTPEIHFCGISVKDKSTKVNLHTDNWDENKLKILGILNSDWDNRQDGGGFIYEDMSYSLQPMNFLIFDSRQTHSNDISKDEYILICEFCFPKTLNALEHAKATILIKKFGESKAESIRNNALKRVLKKERAISTSCIAS